MQFNHSRLTLQKFWEELPYEVSPKAVRSFHIYARSKYQLRSLSVKA